MSALLELHTILDLADPVESPPWGCGRALTPAMVYEALDEDRLRNEPLSAADDNNPLAHASRIAWLMTHGWKDPIELSISAIDVFAKSDDELDRSEWPVIDGNHRLYAAALRGDIWVFISFAAG